MLAEHQPTSALAPTSTPLALGVQQQAQTLPCFMVNNLTKNTEEQCKFMFENDCLEAESTFDYAHLVYCDISHEYRYASILLVLSLVVVLFLNLSAVADEFLCPSLLTVAKSLHMSDSLAGITLLAFGNGCPDIFSSLAAASSGRPEIIVGELLGAGIFCTSIVAGLIFIHSDFQLARRPLLRDATFYLLAVYLIWLYCYQGAITFYGSSAFIIIYVIYLFFALSGQAMNSRLRGDYPIEEARRRQTEKVACLHPPQQGELESWLKWREESLRRGSLEWSPTADLNRQKPTRKSLVLRDDLFTIKISYKNCSSKNFEFELQSDKLRSDQKKSCDIESDCARAVPSISRKCQEQLAAVMREKPEPELVSADGSRAREPLTLREIADFLAKTSPIDFGEWTEAKLLRRLILTLRAPLLLLAILTVPVVNSERRNNNWNRLLNSIHCFMVPIAFLLFTGLGSAWPDFDGARKAGAANLEADGDERLASSSGRAAELGGELGAQSESSALSLRLVLLVPSVALALFVLYSTSAHRAPKYHAAYAYFGFAMSVLWIYVLATEIISILKTVGIIFSMTDTAIGLGVLAWGNSLGDIVANLTLAEAGYARMALGASIGAPLLNLLLGFGLAFTVSLKPGQSLEIKHTPTTGLLAGTLALVLILLMLSTLAPGHRSKRPLGYLLIGCYGVYFALAVCLECGLIKV